MFLFFQADLQSTLGDAGYIVFGVILFVWELLPTSLVVFFFRVRQPNIDRVSQRLKPEPAVPKPWGVGEGAGVT